MRLSVASVNLHCGLDRHGGPFSVKEAIASLDTDVVLVQENWSPRGADSAARSAAADCGYPEFAELPLTAEGPLAGLHIGCPVPDESGTWGLALLSRFPLTGVNSIALGAAPGDVVGFRRAQTAQITVAGGHRIRLVNAHITYRLTHGPGQLRRLVAGLGDGPPTLIGGDLNMFWPTVRLARSYRRAVRGRTFPAHRPVAQIDHLLAGPGLTAERSAVLPSVGSDHRPVRADLTVGPPDGNG